MKCAKSALSLLYYFFMYFIFKKREGNQKFCTANIGGSWGGGARKQGIENRVQTILLYANQSHICEMDNDIHLINNSNLLYTPEMHKFTGRVGMFL